MIRPIRIEGDLAYVPLTQGREAIIDVADVPLVEGFNWFASVRKNTVYAQRIDRSSHKRRAVYMHRALMCEPSGLHIDHIDGDGLNNCRHNIRVATSAQNSQNKRLAVCNTSGMKGVSREKTTDKWRAQIVVHGKHVSIGRFATPEAAHDAYCKASARLHGEFGRVV